MTPSKTQPALFGGLAIGVLSALPVINIANCCCAWILFGGALAAYLMQQNHPEPVGAGDGAVVGLLSGIVGTFVWLVISVPIGLAMAPFQTQMLQRALQNANDMPPAAREFLEALSGGASGGALAVGLGTIIGFFVMLFFGSIFGMLGGLFGAMIFRKNAAQSGPPPIPNL